MASAVGESTASGEGATHVTMNRSPDELAEGAPPGPQAIRDLRARLGLTQEEFAHAIAVTVSTVNRWENGHANPSKLAWRAIQTLARKRGVAIAERRARDQS
jgi:putative transcriptional regulator